MVMESVNATAVVVGAATTMVAMGQQLGRLLQQLLLPEVQPYMLALV
jgi:hypothetical protein